MATTLAFLRASHFVPTLTVTSLSFILAWRTSNLISAIGIAATVFTGQLVVGWTNDYLDYSDDLFHKRERKPLVAGLISPSSLRYASFFACFALLVLTLFGPLNTRYGLAHILAVSSAVAYNFKLKATPISFLPYAFSFGLLPFIVLGTTSQNSEIWMVSIGALFGVGVHFANVFKDLDNDRVSGIYGLPQIMGVQKSKFVCALSFGASGLILALNTSEKSSWVVVFASMIFLLPLPRRFMFPFAIALGLAVMSVLLVSIT